MPISTTLVGESLGRCDTLVTARRMLAYAAAVGELAPQCFDDLHPDFMAPPALCVAIEWPLLIAPQNLARITADAGEAARVIHVIQDSHFHRPVRSGDRLTTEGVIHAVWRSKVGASVASELRTVDADARPVVTSWLESVYRGVEVAGADRPPARPAVVPVDERTEHTLVVNVPTDPAMAHVYSECSGIWNPIHTERRVARALGLPDRILHGTASWALAGREIVRLVGGADSRRLRRLRGRFAAMAVAGAPLELRLSVSRQVGQQQVSFSLLDPDGRSVIADGLAVLDEPPTARNPA